MRESSGRLSQVLTLNKNKSWARTSSHYFARLHSALSQSNFSVTVYIAPLRPLRNYDVKMPLRQTNECNYVSRPYARSLVVLCYLYRVCEKLGLSGEAAEVQSSSRILVSLRALGAVRVSSWRGTRRQWHERSKKGRSHAHALTRS